MNFHSSELFQALSNGKNDSQKNSYDMNLLKVKDFFLFQVGAFLDAELTIAKNEQILLLSR